MGKKDGYSGESPKDRAVNLMDKFIHIHYIVTGMMLSKKRVVYIILLLLIGWVSIKQNYENFMIITHQLNLQ